MIFLLLSSIDCAQKAAFPEMLPAILGVITACAAGSLIDEDDIPGPSIVSPRAVASGQVSVASLSPPASSRGARHPDRFVPIVDPSSSAAPSQLTPIVSTSSSSSPTSCVLPAIPSIRSSLNENPCSSDSLKEATVTEAAPRAAPPTSLMLDADTLSSIPSLVSPIAADTSALSTPSFISKPKRVVPRRRSLQGPAKRSDVDDDDGDEAEAESITLEVPPAVEEASQAQTRISQREPAAPTLSYHSSSSTPPSPTPSADFHPGSFSSGGTPFSHQTHAGSGFMSLSCHHAQLATVVLQYLTELFRRGAIKVCAVSGKDLSFFVSFLLPLLG